MRVHQPTSAKSPSKTASSFSVARRGLLQRKCACGGTPGPTGECDECRKKKLQRRLDTLAPSIINHQLSTVSEVPPIVHRVLRSSGQPLDAETRAFMEARFGHDFSSVRLHTDTRAAESARAVNALAYTVGRDVVFGSDQYWPATSIGRRLMAHELTHVVQQMATPRTASIGFTRSTYNASEQEAEQVASTIQTDGPLHIAQNAPQRTLARVEDSEAESTTASGCRKVTETPCPGTRGQFTRIEYFRKMFLVNRGTCPLFVAGLDANGNVINPTEVHFELSPGDSGTFFPQEGSVGVGFGCEIDCRGAGALEHPYLCA